LDGHASIDQKVFLMGKKRDFTDRFLKSLKPAPKGKRVLIFDAQIAGFGIRVSDRSNPESVGAFVLVTRFPGNSNPVPRWIGDYPGTSLSAAREVARQWRGLIAQGIDPKVREAELRREADRRRAETFSAVFQEFADDHLSTLRTGKFVAAVISKHVMPKWADRPISELRRPDVQDLIRAVRKSSPIGANRLLAYLKKFFSWAVDQDLLEASPAAAVKRPSKENRRDRVLTDFELRAIWEACGQLGPFGRAFKLMLATAQRRTEVGALSRREINPSESLWSLPRERAKSDRAHEIPLSPLAMSIIDECPKSGDYLFTTGRTVRGEKSQSRTARPISGWSKAKMKLDALTIEKAKAKAKAEGMDVPKAFPAWHLHDLRRTAATHLARLGVDRVVIAKVLNHSEREVTATYDRYTYDLEKRRALELWGERLTAIIESRPNEGRIIQFPGRVL
jgi:integrase